MEEDSDNGEVPNADNSAGITPAPAATGSNEISASEGPSNAITNELPNRPQQNARQLSARGSSEAAQNQRDREERLRHLREQQLVERQKKLEEIKQQAAATQRYRDQQEEERRRRMENLKLKESERRVQVEERKRQIIEAEQERRESILRKNTERDVRLESKRRNERSAAVFAFGSSTPRMLQPVDQKSPGSLWGARRATSTNNINNFGVTPFTRRSVERDLDGSKKRATSAHGLHRKPEQESENNLSGFVLGPPTRGRRKTDLMPTIPSPRDSLAQHKAFAQHKSPGDVTPTPSTSRPQSALSQQSLSSHTSSVSMRHHPGTSQRRVRPISIAGTGITASLLQSGHLQQGKSTEKKTGGSHHVRGSSDAPKIPPKPLHLIKKPSSGKSDTFTRKTASKPSSVKATPKSSPSLTPSVETVSLIPTEEVAPQPTIPIVSSEEEVSQDVKLKEEPEKQETDQLLVENKVENKNSTDMLPAEAVPVDAVPAEAVPAIEDALEMICSDIVIQDISNLTEGDIYSPGTKSRIITADEAKAAIAEKRRLAREQAEREAELERLRLAEEQRLEEEARLREEEEMRALEAETLRLEEERRLAEEERLQIAIEENERREQEELERREEEARQKIEKEEMDRKAKEEADRMRIEMEERLRREEEERQARRKRVEAIMSRTRGKNNTSSKTESGEPTGSPVDDESHSPGSSIQQEDNLDQEEVVNLTEDVTQAFTKDQNIQLESGLVLPSKAMETSEDTSPELSHPQRNGHKESSALQDVELLIDSGVRSKPLLDLSDFDCLGLSNGNSGSAVPTTNSDSLEQFLGLTTSSNTMPLHLNNEDSLNSNVASNGTSSDPINSSIPDLLS